MTIQKIDIIENVAPACQFTLIKDAKKTVRDLKLIIESKLNIVAYRIQKQVLVQLGDDVKLRLFEIIDYYIYKTFLPGAKIKNINNQYCTLRPEQEKRDFGNSFYLKIHNGDTIGQIKPLIKSKLEFPDEKMAKLEFARITLNTIKHLGDSSRVSIIRMKKMKKNGVLE